MKRRPLAPRRPVRVRRALLRADLLIGVSWIALWSANVGALAASPPALPGFAPGRNAAGASSSAAAGLGTPAASAPHVQQSINNLQAAARAISAGQALQGQARAAALAASSTVPDGLGSGGLLPLPGATAGSTAWQGAALPTQTAGGGRTAVTVRQNASRAILNWRNFNVGRNTDLTFDQTAGGSSARTWSVLNRVQDPAAQPSQILGSIRAQGQVLVVNANGVIFSGTSQVNVGSLVAAAAQIADSQYLNHGIYSSLISSTTPLPLPAVFTSTGAQASVTVAPGAQISAAAPPDSTSRGGSVILFGPSVSNGGAISTPFGQTILAAGQTLALLPGYAPLATGATPQAQNLSTTLGSDSFVTGGGMVANGGVIQAVIGDVTLQGQTVMQAGVIYSTTSVNQRGTIHLLTSTQAKTTGTSPTISVTADPASSITFSSGSVTQIGLDVSGTAAVDSQRAGLIAESQTLNANRATTLGDLLSESRIEITSGGGVAFRAGSLTVATGGQIAVTAKFPAVGTAAPVAPGRVFIESGAILDVSGSVDVTLPASANTVQVNIQGFELRDSPNNRETGKLASQNVTLDASTLVQVPASAAYASDRYYTAGGLLEVSGELGNQTHTIQEWTTPGGSVAISANEFVAQSGAQFNLAGGSVRYLPGTIATSWLVGSDGHLYNINTAPANITYTGFYQGFRAPQPRWSITQTFGNPLIAPATILEAGYTVGRDGGRLTISAPTSAFSATIDAGVIVGERQTAIHASGTTDSYAQAQNVAPLPATVLLGNYASASGEGAPFPSSVLVADSVAATADSLAPATPLSATSLGNTANFNAGQLSGARLGGLSIATQGSVEIDDTLTLAPGAAVQILAPLVTVNGTIAARGGSVTIGNNATGRDFASTVKGFLEATTVGNAGGSGSSTASGGPATGVLIGASATIDTRGLWTNAALDPNNLSGEAFVSGGPVTIDTSQTIQFGSGGIIDSSGGGIVSIKHATTGGHGGDIKLVSYDVADANPVSASIVAQGTPVTIAGTLRSIGGEGSAGGGALTIAAPSVLVSDAPPAGLPSGVVTLGSSFFASGFSGYTLLGYNDQALPAPGAQPLPSVSVASGTTVTTAVPVYRFTAQSQRAPTGSDPASAMTLGLPALYRQDPVNAVLTERAGASIKLQSTLSGGNAFFGIQRNNANLPSVAVGSGASVNVDPNQQITLEGPGQITVLGALTAHSGTVSLIEDTRNGYYQPGVSVWLGASARVDASAAAVTAIDARGRPYGIVPAGGSVYLGSASTDVDLESATGSSLASVDAFVIVRPGAWVDASGTAATVDLSAGTSTGLRRGPPAQTLIPSAAGAISINSDIGIVLDGTLRAAAGGSGVPGGSLAVALGSPFYNDPNLTYGLSDIAIIKNLLEVPREIGVGSRSAASVITTLLQPGDAIPRIAIGQSSVSAQQVASGGFDSLLLASSDTIRFTSDVSLSVGRRITLTAGAITSTVGQESVVLTAPYVSLFGLSNNSSGLPPGPLLNRNAIQPQGSAASWVPSTTSTSAALTVQAGVVDVTNNVVFGFNINAPTALPKVLDEPGFANVTIASGGDIRFQPGVGATGMRNTYLANPGNLTLSAAQIYPATGALAMAEAIFTQAIRSTVGTISSGVLRIEPAAGPQAQPPLSVGGQLTLQATVIEQGGVVLAPEGALILSATQPPSGSGLSNIATGVVNLLPGSVTSVSMFGQTIPYGGTADGLTYTLNGATLLGGQITGSLNPVLTLAGNAVSIQPGATIDLRGGGALTGAGFVSGRGGSTDVLVNPLQSIYGGTLTSNASDSVYAIIPGSTATVAPPAEPAQTAGAAPAVGAQVTIGSGIPGLSAGTYTLFPGTDALLPGAFRIQFNSLSANASTNRGAPASPRSLGNGSTLAAVSPGTAGTGFMSPLPVQAIITPGAVIRSYATYNEVSYSQAAASAAALFGARRGQVPEDAKTLQIALIGASPYAVPSAPGQGLSPSLSVQGSVLFSAAAGGYSGNAFIGSNQAIQVISSAVQPAPGVVSLRAPDLNALGAGTLVVGGSILAASGTSNIAVVQNQLLGSVAHLGIDPQIAPSVTLRDGASLSAPQVLLVGGSVGITVEQGATINTHGFAQPNLDSIGGLLYQTTPFLTTTVLAVANGLVDFLPPTSSGGPVSIGVCLSMACSGPVHLYTDGTIAVSTTGATAFSYGEAVLGARYLSLAVSSVNLGTDAALAAAKANGTLGSGLSLGVSVLGLLLNGDPTVGTPALQQLTLTASQSVNLYGSVNLNTSDPVTGRSTLDLFQINAPAIYGAGTPADVATITTGELIWNGVVAASGAASQGPPAVIAGGPGSGAGTFNVVADKILLGYGPFDQPQNQIALSRTVLGFSSVNLQAASQITTANNGSLTVYQSGTFNVSRALVSGAGGNLNLVTPTLTGAAGSVFSVAAGGSLSVTAPSGSQTGSGLGAALGATLALSGGSGVTKGGGVSIGSTIALPEGSLSVTARTGDITLATGSRLDLSGRASVFFDQTQYGPGGTLALESALGNVIQQSGASIDVSATNAAAGGVNITAINGAAILGGSLSGGTSSTGGAAASASGGFNVRASALDFLALNKALDQGSLFGSRSFDIQGPGDLTIADGEVRANSITVSVDQGSLTVNGLMSASGPNPGSIRLSAKNSLTLSGSAVLDAHATVPHLDSYGVPIAAEDRATVELTASTGTLTLAPGSTIDVAAADPVTVGTVTLNAPRSSGNNNVQFSASGPFNLSGASSVVLNAFKIYTNVTTIAQSGTAAKGVALLTGATSVNTDNTNFMAAALANPVLASELAGVVGADFHFRPGVEIDSAAGGNLAVNGSLDLSGLRYNARQYGLNKTSSLGSGEPGMLILRTSGTLTVSGSVTDGFAFPRALSSTLTSGTNGPLYAIAPMLPLGPNGQAPLSWSYRFVSGAALAAADTRIVQPVSALGIPAISTTTPPPGSLVLNDKHTQVGGGNGLIPSVLRTGIGDIELVAGGSVVEQSLFGVYTAGAQTTLNTATNPAADVPFNLARGDINTQVKGGSPPPYVLGTQNSAYVQQAEQLVNGSAQNLYQANYPDGGGNLLVSAQADVLGFQTAAITNSSPFSPPSGAIGNWLWRQGGSGQPAAWWINFGTFVAPVTKLGVQDKSAIVTGFVGFGALGGGNVTIAAGRNAGATGQNAQAIDVAIGSTGRMASGGLVQTGGGDIKVIAGGSLNGFVGASTNDDTGGTIVDLRGRVAINAGSVGTITPFYGTVTPDDPRPTAPLSAAKNLPAGGITLALGDSSATITTLGDLVLASAPDPGRVQTQNYTPVAVTGLPAGRAAGAAWFTLWRPATAIELLSIGGNLTPDTLTATGVGGFNSFQDGPAFVYPPTLKAVAASGNIYFGVSQSASARGALELAPSASGQLELLASGSVSGNAFAGTVQPVDISGADTSVQPTPANPSQVTLPAGQTPNQTLFVGTDTASGTLHAEDSQPARVYAATGDLLDVTTGAYLATSGQYIAAKPAWLEAARDIVNLGTVPTSTNPAIGSLLLNNTSADTSFVSAGRDILYANIRIAGPGDLVIQAGRDFYQGAQGQIESVGPINAVSGGASVTVLAGVGASGADWSSFAAQYLDPNHRTTVANGAITGSTVAVTYQDQLLSYLQSTFSYGGDSAGALGYFNALPLPQRISFLLPIYFDELRSSGREFNNASSVRYKSYARGREAIATLFPGQGSYQGGITLLPALQTAGSKTAIPGSLIRTDFGGGVNLVAPGGEILLGSDALQTPGGEGVLTEGQGNIGIYSDGSVLLGNSRVFTTFGGGITIWSATGDINAGRGAKSTGSFSPVQTIYDQLGNIALSPSTFTTGAGIATLDPIAGVSAGDVDLIAPLGTIDAGEAGIRVSGNLNLAALVLVNSANIQVSGTTSGVAVVVPPNLGAITAAASATGAQNQTADQLARDRSTATTQAVSLIAVEVSGYSNCPSGITTGDCR